MGALDIKKGLASIQESLEKIFPDLNPTITIYGDESWSVEIDGNFQGNPCRHGGSPHGESMEDLTKYIEENEK